MSAKKRKSGAKASKRTTAKQGEAKKGESTVADSPVPKLDESGVMANRTQEQRTSAAAAARRKKRKGLSCPGVTYRKEAKVIAVKMAEKAKRGSYLHARELRQMAIEDDSRRKPSRRRSRGAVKVLLARLDEMVDDARRANATAVVNGGET
jgi:hypothetical protein